MINKTKKTVRMGMGLILLILIGLISFYLLSLNTQSSDSLSSSLSPQEEKNKDGKNEGLTDSLSGQILVQPVVEDSIEKKKNLKNSQFSKQENQKKGDEKAKNINTVSFEVFQGLAISQGDILLGKVDEDGKSVNQGNAHVRESQRWPTRKIAYYIQPTIENSQPILQALQYISEEVQLEFIPHQEGIEDALVFEPIDQHCLSYVGRIGGLQPVFISKDCSKMDVVHEVFHALGFIHEHSRPDRDDFISIQWNNIPDSYKSQFDFLPEVWVKPWMKYQYDVDSIMHYSSQILSQQAKGVSLVKKDNTLLPKATQLSYMDKQKVYDLFR